jgi:DedD protein
VPVTTAVPATSPPPPAKPEATKAESAKAEPDKPPTAEAKDGAARFVVQVGAYADADKAREVRRKLEKAGLKTYTHVAETKDGKRTRVRLGPFATREEADKAADKAKQLEFTPAVLTL